MKKLTILLALVLAPLVGTVALSDFNYLGQGGGGLSESDVQTLIDASIAAAAYVPPEDPSSGEFGNGGLSLAAYQSVVAISQDPASYFIDDKFIMGTPAPQTGDWLYYLCGADVPTVLGSGGPTLDPTCTSGASIDSLDTIPLAVTCSEVGLFSISVFIIDGSGNTTGANVLLVVEDPLTVCGP